MSDKKVDEKKIERIANLMAEKGIEEALESVSVEDIDYLFGIGVVVFEEGIYEIAEKIFDRIVRLAPENALAWLCDGLTLGNLGKYEEEIHCYDEALKIDPHLAQAWSNKGVALGNLGKYEEAIHCYDEALKIDPHYAQAWSNKGVALGKLGKYEEEIHCYDEALKIDPHLVDAYFNLGLTFLDLYQYKNAILNLQKAKELFLERKSKNDSDKTTAYQLWAEALQNWSIEEYDKAISHFNRAISIFRDLQFDVTANSLELIIKIIPLDRQFMDSLYIQDLTELKEKTSKVCKGMQELLDSIKEKDMSEDAEEILFAKAHCFNALRDALEFKESDFEILSEARKTFEKLRFDASIAALNSLDSIIRVLRRYKRLEDIPGSAQDSILLELESLSAIDGALTGKIHIKKEYHTAKPTAKGEELEIVPHFIENVEKEWVRIGLVQFDFSLEYIRPPEEFGYTLEEKEKTKKRIFEALEIAHTNNVDIICFPELSTLEEWIHEAKQYKDIIIVFGTYYKNGFNTCPIIVKGQDYYIQKINPSPQFETEVIHGRKMKKGKKIFVFQTKCGSFAVLICMDYLKEAHHILSNSDEKIRNIDFLIIPGYNKDVNRFQKQGDIHCLTENSYPYVLQVNSWKVFDKEAGGTCVIGAEHKDALNRYKMDKLKPDDPIEYKLIETDRESIILVDLDIKRKGVPVPASGPKMKVLQKYIYENGKWNATDFS